MIKIVKSGLMVRCRACGTFNKHKLFCGKNCRDRYYRSLTLQPIKKPLVDFIKDTLDEPINNSLIRRIEVVDSIPGGVHEDWINLFKFLDNNLKDGEIRRICFQKKDINISNLKKILVRHCFCLSVFRKKENDLFYLYIRKN